MGNETHAYVNARQIPTIITRARFREGAALAGRAVALRLSAAPVRAAAALTGPCRTRCSWTCARPRRGQGCAG